MPYKMRKMPNRDCYKVYNRITKKVFSKCSPLEKAKKQLRLLRAIQNNKDFVPNTQVKEKKTRRRTKKT